MNLAYRDIKHNLLRFVLTNFGLSLLLGIVIMITGVYGGLIDDALKQARAANADLWVVEAGTNGPFAEASRIPGDTRELVSRVYGVARAGSEASRWLAVSAWGSRRIFWPATTAGRESSARAPSPSCSGLCQMCVWQSTIMIGCLRMGGAFQRTATPQPANWAGQGGKTLILSASARGVA